MASGTRTWLNFALQQMAAESYLDQFLSGPRSLVEVLTNGNNNENVIPINQFTGKTRFVDLTAVANAAQVTGSAQAFESRYQIVDHHANDASGFSATLMFDTESNSYTLSFRSTEPRPGVEGGDAERDGLFASGLTPAADGEIGLDGFAFGQLIAMERYYLELTTSGKLPAGATLNVTGFSLGGHLATVFTELHTNQVAQTTVFNASGRGRMDGFSGTDAATLSAEAQQIDAMLTRFMAVLFNPIAGVTQSSDEELQVFQAARDAYLADPSWNPFTSGSTENVYIDPRYRWAKLVTLDEFDTVGTAELELRTGLSGIAVNQGPFAKITQLYGDAAFGDDTLVALSGLSAGPVQSILIEGQPLLAGTIIPRLSDAGSSHSITLIVDSLAVQELIQTIDPRYGQASAELLLRAVSNKRAIDTTTEARAEGDSLEKMVDAFRKVFLGPTLSEPNPLNVDFSVGGFANFTFRNEMYTAMAEIRQAVQAQQNQNITFAIDDLTAFSSPAVAGIADTETDRGLAYRYALKELNPFAVVANTPESNEALYAAHNSQGQLDRFNEADGTGTLTAQYLDDRAVFLTEKIALGLLDRDITTRSRYFFDVASDYEIAPDLAIFQSYDNVQQVIFGSDDADTLTAGSKGDHLYGGDGVDVLIGNGGDDYLQGDGGGDQLEGGSGIDTLVGGAGNDVLDGGAESDTLDGGLGNDTLRGGAGLDRYIVRAIDGADTIEDSDGYGVVEFDDKVLLAGLRRTGDPANVFRSADGSLTFTKSGTDLVVTGSGPLTITNFTDSMLGIRLIEMPTIAEATRTVFEKIDHYQQVGVDAQGEPIYEPVYAAFFDDMANDTRNADPIGGLVPELDDRHNLIHAGGGHDTVITAAGDDQVYGEGGDDSLAGRSGHDRLYGGIGNDTINGDDVGALVGGNDYLDGGDGDDVLLGHAGADILLAGSGNDHLEGDDQESLGLGNYGHDYLDGGDGHDSLHGVGGSDVLIGRAGNDFLLGDAALSQGGTPAAGGGDSLDGGDGDDWLDGQFGDDVLVGGLDNDTLNGGDGSDALYGGDGGDILSGDLRLVQATGLYSVADHQGAGGDDLLDGGAGFDYLSGGEGADMLFGDDGDDTLVGDYDPLRIPAEAMATLLNLGGDDYLEGGSGNDSLKGGVGGDRLDGGIGNDTLQGGAGSDSLQGGAGDDVLLGGDGDDLLDGGDGADVLDGGQGIDIVRAGAGDDRLMAGMDNDTLYGEAGHDQLISGNEYFESGNSVLVGGTGNDTYVVDSALDTVVEEADAGVDSIQSFVSYTLPDHVENLRAEGTATGNALNNVLGGQTVDGKAGDDTLSGERYIFGVGYGRDTILDNYGNSVVQFLADVTPEQILWQRSGNDLVLGLDGTSDTLAIPSFYAAAFNQGNYFFSSNIVLPQQTLNLGGTPYYVAPSQVERFEFADGTVWGAEAFDATMIGAYQANTYAFGRGDGIDTILDFDFTGEQPADVLLLKGGVAPSDAVLRRIGDDLVVGFQDTSDQLTVTSHFATVFVRFLNFSGSFLNTYRLEQIQFADGTVWDAAAIHNQIREITGTEFSNVLQGNANDNTILGLGGDDTLYGQQGADVLDGGTGDDTLFGGTGPDVYLFGRGSGRDTIYDDNFSGAEIDTIRLASDVTPGEVTVQATNSENGLVLGITGTSDALTLRFFLDGPFYEIEQIVFADGTAWDTAAILSRATGLSLTGTEESDYLPGTALNDVLVGLGGNDFLDGRQGDDSLHGDAGDDELAGRAGRDLLQGGEGNDIYYFNPGDGIDTINDIAAAGEGNRIQFDAGIAQADLTLTHDEIARTLTIQVGSTGTDKLVLANFDPTGANGSLVVETLAFANGSEVSLASLLGPTITIFGTDNNDVLVGTTSADGIDAGAGSDTVYANGGDDLILAGEGDDVVTGDEGVDTIFGGGGIDYLYGGIDNDIINGDDGNDTLVGDAGSDVLSGGLGNDVLNGGLGDDTLSGETGNDAVYAGAGNDLITGGEGDDAVSGEDGADTISGGLGTDYLYGGEGDDVINGDEGNDTLVGDVGNDVLTGGLGNDVLNGGLGADQLTGGEGDDSIYMDAADTVNGGAGYDGVTVLGTDGVVFDAAAAQAEFVGGSTGNDVITAVGGLSNVTFYGGDGHDQLIGGTGNDVLVGQAGNDQLLGGLGDDILNGGEGDDVLTGEAGNDAFYGGAGNDLVNGGDGDDAVSGEEGADTIFGGSGTDYLYGGEGDDALNGEEGNDTLVGDLGHDILRGGAGNDVLNGGAGADQFYGGEGDDTIYMDAADTVVNGGAGSDAVSVLGLDGVTLDATAAEVEFVGGSSGNDVFSAVGSLSRVTLYGGDGNDQLTGGDGHDVLVGQAGDDQLIGGLGDDILNGSDGNDVLTGGAGNDAFYGGMGDDQLTGGEGDDSLAGDEGADLLVGGTGRDYLYGGDGDDILSGNEGHDVLVGNAGADAVAGGLGDDYLTGGTGNDQYTFMRGEGADTISEDDATVGNNDRLLFGNTINPLDLVLSRQADNLRLAIHGTSEQIVVENWYLGDAHHVETVQAGNGETLLNTQVDQLIQAMATFSQQTGLTWDQGIEQRPQEVQAVLAASWQ